MKKLILTLITLCILNTINAQNYPRTALVELDKQYNTAKNQTQQENDYQTIQALLHNLNAKNNIINSMNNQYQKELRYFQNEYNNYKSKIYQQYSGYELKSNLQKLDNNFSINLQNLKSKYEY